MWGTDGKRRRVWGGMAGGDKKKRKTGIVRAVKGGQSVIGERENKSC